MSLGQLQWPYTTHEGTANGFLRCSDVPDVWRMVVLMFYSVYFWDNNRSLVSRPACPARTDIKLRRSCRAKLQIAVKETQDVLAGGIGTV